MFRLDADYMAWVANGPTMAGVSYGYVPDAQGGNDAVSNGGLNIILNDARLFPSMSVDPGDPQSGVSVADPPVTKWGNIEITKKDAGTTMLAGAQFRVYPTPPTPRPAPTG